MRWAMSDKVPTSPLSPDSVARPQIPSKKNKMELVKLVKDVPKVIPIPLGLHQIKYQRPLLDVPY